MHKLNLTKESSLPPPPFAFLLHPSIPLLSGAQPRSRYPLVISSRVWKNKRSDWSNGLCWAEGRGISVQAAAAMDSRAHAFTACVALTREITGMWRDGVGDLGGYYQQSVEAHHACTYCLFDTSDYALCCDTWAPTDRWPSKRYTFGVMTVPLVWGARLPADAVLTHWRCRVTQNW